MVPGGPNVRSKLCKISRMSITHVSLQLCPDFFNRIEVWAVWGPKRPLNAVLLQKVAHDDSAMRSRIIVLKLSCSESVKRKRVEIWNKESLK